MKIGFFVNDIAREEEHFATTILANEASRRGHTVCYVTPSDFSFMPDDRLCLRARFAPKKKFASYMAFFKAIQDRRLETRTIDAADLDVLMLRNDPSNDAVDRPWAEGIGVLFGRIAAEQGVLVLNDPDGLGQATNKLYFQSFPESLRAPTLISKDVEAIKRFANEQGEKIVLKPLRGSGGQSVFVVGAEKASNLNQMIEAISRDGYVIAQAYVPAAKDGDIRFFLINGVPLRHKGHYAAFRRTSASDDVRSNIHAGGTASKAEIGETELAVAELVRPKLIRDGMFLVGLDIVGDKILEINVFSPGGLRNCSRFEGVRFSVAILDAIENKLAIRRQYPGRFSNRELAVL
ncbi:MAG: glutathione synthase [Lautropia sp.]|nr:glutathione synthase [Lautropia sp.]